MNVTIIQDNSRVELLGSNGAGIIQKLYELATNTNNVVTLTGNIKSNYAYGYQVDYLNGMYNPDFVVSADNRYMQFESSITESVLANIIGDGVGVPQQATSITSLPSGLGQIDKFKELKFFTNIHTLSNGAFGRNSVSNPNRTLISVDLENITTLGNVNQSGGTGGGPFEGCYSLSYLGNTSNIVYLGTYALRGCGALDSTKWYVFDSIQQAGTSCFRDSGITKVVFGDQLNRIAPNTIFTNDTKTKKCVILAPVPPTLSSSFTSLNSDNRWGLIHRISFYVPDEVYTDYCADSEWGLLVSSEFLNGASSNLFKISELSNDDKTQLQEVGINV